jgi:hypothetical protein
MTAAGQDASAPAAGTSGKAPRSRGSALGNRAALVRIGMAATAHMLRSRRTYQRLAVAAIGAVALTRIGKESQASSLARLQAWDKKQLQRFERRAQHHRHGAR